MALINAGHYIYDLAYEFKTDVETIETWISRLNARAEDAPGEAETKPAEEKPAEEAPAADPAPGQDAPPEKKRPGRPRAKIRKDVIV
jgi:hypothetical protein